MRILYIDIDTLRPDHLGCYGYHRDTSPHIDGLAAQGIRFDGCYASDVPCLPSRSALSSGRFGIHNGVIGHGGTAADPFIEGPSRGFFSVHAKTSFPALLRKSGLHTVTLSSFAHRHSAFHWFAGFDEAATVGKLGLENADEACELAHRWLQQRGRDDNWFMHLHLWDPHTPYRVPDAYGEPFADDPLPAWLTEDVRAAHYAACGPHSAQEAVGFTPDYPWGDYPRQPRQIDSQAAVRQMFDGYDTGVRFADDEIGKLLQRLRALGIEEETAIMVSADHGETLGELNVYGDHHTADEHTAKVPMILRWPGLSPGVQSGLHYQIDVAATVLQLLEQPVPDVWDGVGFATELGAGQAAGRPFLVLSQGAWTCQRAVRWDRYLCIRTYHDGYHGYDATMLFDLEADPHEQHNLAATHPKLVEHAEGLLGQWHAEAMSGASHPDPMESVLAEGGPFHTRGKLEAYLQRLRETGRVKWAARLRETHPDG